MSDPIIIGDATLSIMAAQLPINTHSPDLAQASVVGDQAEGA